MSRENFILVTMPGDGVGPEVTREAVRVIDWFRARRGLGCRIQEEISGVAAYKAHGTLLRDETLADIMAADAVLFGAMGGPEFEEIPLEIRRAGNLPYMRRALAVFANLRPIVGHAALADSSPLKADVIEGVDMIVVRELNGGIYFGEPRGIETLESGIKRGVNTLVYTTPEIERIARVAFDLAMTRGRRVCSVDKANVMDCSILWREVVQGVRDAEYPDIDLTHMYVDNCALQVVRNPGQFDVLVTDNMFGDILSDCAGAVSGSLGMLPSASLGAPDKSGRRRALYEPIHGTAPDIAGQGIANPLGAILSVALALRHSFARDDDAVLLEAAVGAALAGGARTRDIVAPGMAAISTSAMGDAVIDALERAVG